MLVPKKIQTKIYQQNPQPGSTSSIFVSKGSGIHLPFKSIAEFKKEMQLEKEAQRNKKLILKDIENKELPSTTPKKKTL